MWPPWLVNSQAGSHIVGLRYTTSWAEPTPGLLALLIPAPNVHTNLTLWLCLEFTQGWKDINIGWYKMNDSDIFLSLWKHLIYICNSDCVLKHYLSCLIASGFAWYNIVSFCDFMHLSGYQESTWSPQSIRNMAGMYTNIYTNLLNTDCNV